jgi:hypothetical protein
MNNMIDHSISVVGAAAMIQRLSITSTSIQLNYLKQFIHVSLARIIVLYALISFYSSYDNDTTNTYNQTNNNNSYSTDNDVNNYNNNTYDQQPDNFQYDVNNDAGNYDYGGGSNDYGGSGGKRIYV